MQVVRTMPEMFPKPCVATIGFFDGVHCGHRFLIKQVCEAATERGYASTVVTFPTHPRKVMQADFCPRLLTTYEEKIDLLGETGLDYCMILDFTLEVATLSAREFMAFLQKHYNIQALVVGYDHRFGHNRSEGFADYVNYGKELGMEVLLAQAYLDKSIAVSSSGIRNLLLSGDVSEAAIRLGYDYFLDGTVITGYRVGRTIGFPTANLRVDNADKLLPSDGVYAVRVTVGGKVYSGMLDIGTRPTFDNGGKHSIEVHILHFHADIYGEVIRLSFVRYIRPDIKFASVDELIAQLHKDAKTVEGIL
ncbi:MAG: bifunctional riboflavin kinase/FAD synthetase [Bacteroides sp.]|jgi:riboflavin kinase/FMN adenylyltransferase|nr:bifunctional riboflavin kinase/FAD synthetase [Bacteroides sp.]MCI1683563.1 bifunctional riboflavin kinase/FAD synthetase [Bacteroides sp.]